MFGGRAPRRDGPFVAVNCAAIVETLLEAELFGIEERTATGVRGRMGKFEHAHGGTLFLDEVADLSAAAQAQPGWLRRVDGSIPSRLTNLRSVFRRRWARLCERESFGWQAKLVVSVKWWKSVSASSSGSERSRYAAFSTRSISSQPSIFRNFT